MWETGIALLPSARPSPKVNTHFPAGAAARASGFLAGAGRALAISLTIPLAVPLAIALTAAFGNAFRTVGTFLAEALAAAGLERGRETDFDEALAMMSVAGCNVGNWHRAYTTLSCCSASVTVAVSHPQAQVRDEVRDTAGARFEAQFSPCPLNLI